ncbi:MAG: hypothetical protein WC901_00685 [Candidatus Margulisiibacteriota bacterium]
MVEIYRVPPRIQADAATLIKAAALRQVDFRIKRLDGDAFRGFPACEQRRSLVAEVGSPTRLAPAEVDQLIAALGSSIVGEIASYAEGAQVLAGVVERRPNAEFLIAKRRDDGKLYILKGEANTDPTRPIAHSVELPFIPMGPLMHNHPFGIDPAVTYGDYLINCFFGCPFGIEIGHQRDGRITLSKYYILGPFRSVETRLVDIEQDLYGSIINALTVDAVFPQSLAYASRETGQLLHELDASPAALLAQHYGLMGQHGMDIATLEAELFPLDDIDPQKAIELAQLYLKTQHLFNAILLLERCGLERNHRLKTFHMLAQSGLGDLV